MAQWQLARRSGDLGGPSRRRGAIIELTPANSPFRRGRTRFTTKPAPARRAFALLPKSEGRPARPAHGGRRRTGPRARQSRSRLSLPIPYFWHQGRGRGPGGDPRCGKQEEKEAVMRFALKRKVGPGPWPRLRGPCWPFRVRPGRGHRGVPCDSLAGPMKANKGLSGEAPGNDGEPGFRPSQELAELILPARPATSSPPRRRRRSTRSWSGRRWRERTRRRPPGRCNLGQRAGASSGLGQSQGFKTVTIWREGIGSLGDR